MRTYADPADQVGDTIYRLGSDGRTWWWGTVVWIREAELMVASWRNA